MNTIEDIFKLDKSIKSICDSFFDSNPDFSKIQDYPKSSKLLFNLVKRIESIKGGIFETTRTNNYYSSEILLRVLIEHYLTFMYAYQKTKKEKEDTVGKEYYSERRLKEDYDFWEADNRISKIMDKEELGIDINKKLSEKYPDLINLSKKDIDQKFRQFKMQEMIKYFIQDLDAKTIDKDVSAFSNLRYFRDWVQLSSFIHCGPLADEIYSSYSNSKKGEERLINIAEFTFRICTGIKSLCLIHFSSYDMKLFSIALEVNRIGESIKLPKK